MTYNLGWRDIISLISVAWMRNIGAVKIQGDGWSFPTEEIKVDDLFHSSHVPVLVFETGMGT